MRFKRLSIIFLLLFANVFCIGQSKTIIPEDSLLKIISCGPFGADLEHPQKVASNHFGFKYIFVDSLCNPHREENVYGKSKYVDIYNDSVFKLIAHRNGSDWEERFGKEIKRLYNIQEKVRRILKSNKSIPNLPITFSEDMEDNKFIIWVDETGNRNIINVNVLSWLKDIKPSWNIIYRLQVDIQKKGIKVVSKKIEPLQ